MSIAAKGLWAGILLAIVLLSGCSNQAGGQATTVATAEAETVEVTQILTGKISSINGNEITLYTATNDGIKEEAVATSSEESSGADVAEQTIAPVVAGDESPVALPQFTDETITITVSEDTKFLQAANANGQGEGSSLVLTDLKAGDIIEVTLNSETLTAGSIVVQADKVAGGGLSVPSPTSTSPVASPPAQPGSDSSARPQQSPGAAPGKGQASPQRGAGQQPAGTQASPPAKGIGGGTGKAPGKTQPTTTSGAAPKPTAIAKPATSAKPTATANTTDTGTANASGTGVAANVNRGMSFGKIKSISGSSITIYTAEAGGAPPQNGVASEKDAQGDQGTKPQISPTGEPTAESGQGAGGMPQGGRQQSFSDDTTVITVSSTTKLLSVTFDNGTRKDAEIALSTLKAGDIIQYSLKSGTTEATSISLNSGNPIGGQ